MATESPMRIMDSNRGRKWASSRGPASFVSQGSSVVNDELGLLLRGHNVHRDQSNIAPNRSGSAPPSMEGSVAAFDQLVADTSYSTFYPSNIDLNPRFSPPTISRENIQFGHHSGSSENNWRLTSVDGRGSGSLYMPRVSLPTHEEEPEDDSPSKGASDDMGEASTAQKTLSFTGRHKSLFDLIQEDFPRTPSPIFSQTASLSHVEEQSNHEVQSLSLDSLSLKASKSPEAKSGTGSGDITETSTESIAKQEDEPNSEDCVLVSDGITGSDINKGLHSAEDGRQDKQLGFNEQNVLHPQNYHVPGYQMERAGQGENNMENLSQSHLKMTSVEMQPLLHTPGVPPPLYATTAAYMAPGSSFYPNFTESGVYAPQYSGYAMGSSYLPPYLTGHQPRTEFAFQYNPNSGQSFSGHQSTGSPTGESIIKGPIMQNPETFYGHQRPTMHPTFPDPLQMQYFQQLVQNPYSVQAQFSRFLPHGMIGSQVDSFALRNDPSVVTYMGDQKFQLPMGSLSIPSPRNIGVPNSSYLGSPTGLGFVPQSPFGSPVLPGSPIAGSGRRYEVGFNQSSPRNVGGYGRWQGQRGTDSVGDHRKHTFLEELKTSGAHRIDLADVYGRIVEFSIDQHGSRFIQQKLENCSAEEKESVFNEVLPHAPKLITDVFGNYVIQKFFEHGTYQQRKELASQLSGHMLPLSLQMYGCRVIQKALEVIELDKKTELVLELDGHVMRCVRDQNGNHVIQKCIECLPAENIDFIISAFEGHVAMLSTHPYGCRVIQRILEHCSDDVQCRSIVDEILESAYDLAQDQYGNYVIQHVLERGKPYERSKIISKLSGKVVQMSQHKYASNVVEKCLEFGDAAERELLIEEILVQSEDNDSLLAMMKDQFANYVVQKILEISCDRQREILLSRIQIHVDGLKKYTYGKHIVSRFEQLIGEGSGSSDG